MDDLLSDRSTAKSVRHAEHGEPPIEADEEWASSFATGWVHDAHGLFPMDPFRSQTAGALPAAMNRPNPPRDRPNPVVL